MEDHSCALISGGYLAVAVSKMVTKMLHHCDLDERQTDGSRHWDTQLRQYC